MYSIAPFHAQAPLPTGPVVEVEQITSLELAIDHALAKFHKCVDKYAAAKDPDVQQHWSIAASSYLGSYYAMGGLRSLGGDQTQVAIQLMAAAKYYADEAVRLEG